MGAAPPRPRRVGSAPAAPRPSACRLWGAAPPTPPSRRSTRCARLWPARPRSFVLWRLRPHAPDGLAAQPRRRGRARVVSGGLRPPHPHRGRACAARGSGPPALGVSFCGGAAPTPPTGRQRDRGPEAERVSSLGGCAPHAPIADEHALRAALPTRPPWSFFLWGLRPHAPEGLAAPPRPRGRARVSAWLRPAPRWTGTGDAASGNAEPRAQVSGARWPSTSTRRNLFCYGYLDAPRRPGDQVARRRTRK